ncbi:MAG: sugar phosphate nucleotidyltransferase [Bacteroidota bacterium]
MKPTLMILAAGMGSRYGGLKQVDGVGPNGEAIIEYSIYDAIEAGFGKVVFIIRKSIEEAFKAKFANKFENKITIEYVFQELDSPIEGIDSFPPREKPWGTGHAILVAREVVKEPFAVINADDYYGATAFHSIAKFLTTECAPDTYGMVGYVLKNTLSDNGAVSRGVCDMDAESYLTDINERFKVRREEGKVVHEIEGTLHELDEKTLVSMNLWGFHPAVFEVLHSLFIDFVEANSDKPRAEFFIPLIVDHQIKRETARVKVIPNDEQWYGVTYKEDKGTVTDAFAKFIQDEKYPINLWK